MDEDINLTTQRQRFQVIVNIIQAQLFQNKKAKTKIKVFIGKHKKTIRTKAKKVDCPHYNNHCLFNLSFPLTTLISKTLTVNIYRVSKLRTKLAGGFKVELSTVWSQPNHRFINRWAVLVNPKNIYSEVKGYLKCDILILKKDPGNACHDLVKPLREVDVGECENFTDNLLLPYKGLYPRFRTRLVFCIYRADSFSARSLKSSISRKIRSYVKITYAENVLKTTVTKNKIWNQQLVFFDSGLPLCQNIFIQVCNSWKKRHKKILGNININVSALCEDTPNGFLPCLGPTFLYLYQPLKKKINFYRDNMLLQNSFTYSCRLLIAMQAELVTGCDEMCDKKKKKTSKKHVPLICPLNECAYFRYQKFILFAVVFDVLLFDKTRLTNVALRLTIGPKKSSVKLPSSSIKVNPCSVQQLPVENPQIPLIITTCNRTPFQRLHVKAGCSFVAFGGKFPCMHVYGEWPDSLRKIYRSNVIKRTIQNYTRQVDKIKCDLEFDEITAKESSNKLKRLLINFSKSCEVIMLLTKVITLEDTNLAYEKKRVYHDEISEMVRRIRLVSTENGLIGGDELAKISAYLNRLRKYAQDPENSFPDTEIWILKGGKITAQIRIRTEDITYSPNSHQRGLMSGKIQTLIIRGKKEKIKAKLDVFLWFGLAQDFMHCLKMLPSGYHNVSKPTCSKLIDGRIPMSIIYMECHEFQCRAYLFYAKILRNSNKIRAPNPLAKIIVMGKSQSTRIKKSTFWPVWKETIVLTKIKLYGSLEDIQKNSITITVETYDKKKGWRKLIGRSFVKPVVRLVDKNFGLPKFQWESIRQGCTEVGQILMASELWINCGKMYRHESRFTTPDYMLPPFAIFRLEVLFWGVREMKRKSFLRNKVLATVKCGDKLIKSKILKDVRKKFNFPGCVQYVELRLPDQPEYGPSLSLQLYHIKSFFRIRRTIAICTVPNIRSFCYVTVKYPKQIHIFPEPVQLHRSYSKTEENLLVVILKTIWYTLEAIWLVLIRFFRYCKGEIQDQCDVYDVLQEEIGESECHTCRNVSCGHFSGCKVFKEYKFRTLQDENNLSWWGKYYASIDVPEDGWTTPPLKIYREELESQPEFKGFTDFLHNFDMVVKRKKKGKKEGVVMAKVKAALMVYKMTCKEKYSTLLTKSPSNDPLRFFLRVYIIRGKNLRLRRINCPSKPYLILTLGKQEIKDRSNYALNRVNPMFLKCFEMKGTFPSDHLLGIKVMDRGSGTRDKIIGETTIDLENRYYSRHHASCGISQSFEKVGPTPWRDIHPPTYILQNICWQLNLNRPVYENDRVIIDDFIFRTNVSCDLKDREEHQALSVLHRWHEIGPVGYRMVPEHIETRNLYRSNIPGIEQGQLEMWIDIFPASFHCMPPKVDIKPGCAVPMELRAIVWNVNTVLFEEESFICNEKVSGIYVKSWICSLEEDMQTTDTDCRSGYGKGRFNWRFIFSFNYIPTERMMVKDNHHGMTETYEDRKHRCKLEMQIWDNDPFGDDYLGTLLLELSAMPCGAKLANRCTLKMLAPNATKINLFKIGKTRGWWPFRRKKEKPKMGPDFELTGKIDLELEVLTKAEAALNPAGRGRCEPNALPIPARTGHFDKILAPLQMLTRLVRRHDKYFLAAILVMAIIIVLMAT